MNSLDTNRAFLYGDGFFETFKLINGRCEKFHLHYQRMLRSSKLLEMDWNETWNMAFFEEMLVEKSREFEQSDLRVKLVFYRDSAGTYLPETDNMQFHLMISPYLSNVKDILNCGIYSEAKKPVNMWSGIKSTSAQFYVMASKFMKHHGWDELIILNEYGRVCEGLTSNVFLEKDGQFYTPPLYEGCIDGVYRQSLLMDKNKRLVVEKELTLDELKTGKVYFSNAIRGFIPGRLILYFKNHENIRCQ